ncbi:uncharacterized protein EV422DRAFT_99416 [Fimicolochytrium jonesii]|uniref:uncharacterized protein n=1 Tax=Fimicolochytrium jonesii TaxID=1396493 RepID=UPI0022FDBA76|nr:uncharacterized protein EV422DRAFT_99416 [Fimicolochytrium jonesii]KAI8819620.1 hypothetical protein EV422DRAFT_99416 [Fimicolochytrium jonesii]
MTRLEGQVLAPINVAQTVFPVLRKRQYPAAYRVYFKVCLTVPSIDRTCSLKRQRANFWVRSKFGQLGTPVEVSPRVQEDEIQRSYDVDLNNLGADCWAVVRGFQSQDPGQRKKSRDVWKGTSVVIFQFDLFEKKEAFSDYLDREKARFVELVNNLASQTAEHQLPILFIFSSGHGITALRFKTLVQQAFRLDFVLQHGPLSELRWLDMKYSGELKELRHANENLVATLKSVTEHVSLSPEIRFIGQTDRDDSITTLFPTEYAENAALIQARFPQHLFFDKPCNFTTFNALILNFNNALDVCKEKLTGPEVLRMNHPPFEFASDENGDGVGIERGMSQVRLDWNAPATMEELRDAFDGARLPFTVDGTVPFGDTAQGLGRRWRNAEKMSPLWEIYAGWVETVTKGRLPERRALRDTPNGIPTADGSSAEEIACLFGLLQPFDSTPSSVSGVQFPFQEIVAIGVRATLSRVDTYIAHNFNRLPYPVQLPATAVERHKLLMGSLVGQWTAVASQWPDAQPSAGALTQNNPADWHQDDNTQQHSPPKRRREPEIQDGDTSVPSGASLSPSKRRRLSEPEPPPLILRDLFDASEIVPNPDVVTTVLDPPHSPALLDDWRPDHFDGPPLTEEDLRELEEIAAGEDQHYSIFSRKAALIAHGRLSFPSP